MSTRTQHIDDLVATYAPRGRAQLRSGIRMRLRRAIFGTVAAVLVVAAGSAAWRYDLTERWLEADRANREQAQAILASVSSQLKQAEELRSALTRELEIVVQQRNELDKQQAALREQQEVMAGKLATLNDQRGMLEKQRQLLSTETEEFEQSAARLTARREQLDNERNLVESEAPKLSAALQDLRQQRQELDDEHKRFRAQRRLLETEISRLNEQRASLEDQQQQLKEQWESLQSLQEQASNSELFTPVKPDKGNSAPDDNATPQATLLLAAADRTIHEDELGKIRGGINIGSQREISIGLSRIVDINGVQQYSSSFQLNGMNATGYDEFASMQPVVIQNGPGNLTTPDLGAYSGSLPIVIQNTLDNQHIMNANVLDVSISNVASKAAGTAASMAISDSLALHR